MEDRMDRKIRQIEEAYEFTKKQKSSSLIQKIKAWFYDFKKR